MLARTDRRATRQVGKAAFLAGWNFALRAVEYQSTTEAEDPRTTPGPVSPERLQLANAGILHLSPIVRQLVELWTGPENDEYGRLRPTRDAFDTTVRLLVDAAVEGHFDGRREIPQGCVSTDATGGIRIEWIRDGASVHLIVPAKKDDVAFVYHEIGGTYATEDVTLERLSHWLRAIA